MNVITVGSDERLDYAAELLREACCPSCTAVHLLPIPTSRDGEHISGTDILLKDYLSGLCGGEVLVCYGLCAEMLSPLSDRGVITLDLSRDEEYIAEGAYLTALGTVEYILRGSRRALSDMRIGIVGVGRIGACLSRMLLALGGEAVLFSGRACETLCSKGALVLGYGALASGEFPPLDILINTAPSPILTAPLPAPLADAKIIELASGENIPKEIPHESLPQLPARAFPESAGRAVATAVMRGLG